MTTHDFRQELAMADRRTRRMVLVSAAAHVIGLLLWMLAYEIAPEPLALVEIEWIEPEVEPMIVAASVIEPLIEPVEQEKPVPPAPVEQRFERPEPVAETEPEPQRPEALDDRLRQSLESRPPRPDAAPTLSVARPSTPSTPRPVAVATPVSRAQPEGLARASQTSPGTPAPLERSTQSTAAPRLARVATPSAPSTAPDMARVDDKTARRQLEGALLLGQVADRPLRNQRMPVYPDWARREGVEASVTLTFTVAPDGRLRSNVVIQKTSGHIDFDRSAREALLAWRFEPLPTGTGNDQWGAITFDFRLRD